MIAYCKRSGTLNTLFAVVVRHDFVATIGQYLEKWVYSCTFVFPKTKIHIETTQISPSKDTYKIKNWKKYNKSLEKRGDFSIWIEGSVLSSWLDLTPKKWLEGIYIPIQ